LSSSDTSLIDLLEALLFVAEGPQPAVALAQACNVTEGQAEQALEVLAGRLEDRGGLMLVKIAGGYQLSTKPEFSATVAAFLQPNRQRLTRSHLEVLAIVAYRQPVTAAEIEGIRGVQSDYALRILVERRLVREAGRKKTPGRPILYATTDQFLHQFNLNSLEDLPPLERADDLPEAEKDLFSPVESEAP